MLLPAERNKIREAITTIDEDQLTALRRKIITACQFAPQAILSPRMRELDSSMLAKSDILVFGSDLSVLYEKYSDSNKAEEDNVEFLTDAAIALLDLYSKTVGIALNQDVLVAYWEGIVNNLLENHIVTIKTQPKVVIDALEAPLAQSVVKA